MRSGRPSASNQVTRSGSAVAASILVLPALPAGFVDDRHLGAAIAVAVGRGLDDHAVREAARLLEAAVSVGIDFFADGFARRVGLDDVRALVAVGVELLPGRALLGVVDDQLVVAAVARGVALLAALAFALEEHEGVEAAIAAGVDLLLRAGAADEGRHHVEAPVAVGVALLFHLHAVLEADAQVVLAVAGGVALAHGGAALGVEVARAVHPAIVVGVLLVAGRCPGDEEDRVVDPAVGVAVLFEAKRLAVRARDAPGVPHAVAGGVALDFEGDAARGIEDQPAIGLAAARRVLLAADSAWRSRRRSSSSRCVRPDRRPARRTRASPPRSARSGPAVPRPVESTRRSTITPAAYSASASKRPSKSASVGFAGDPLLGVERVPDVGASVGVAVLGLGRASAVHVADLGVVDAVAGGVGLLTERHFTGVEGDHLGAAIAVGVALLAGAHAGFVEARHVVAPVAVAVDLLALGRAVGQHEGDDLAEAVAVGIDAPGPLHAVLVDRHQIEASVAVAVRFAPGDLLAGLGRSGRSRRIVDHAVGLAVAVRVLFDPHPHAGFVDDHHLEAAVGILVALFALLDAGGVESRFGVDLPVVVAILLDRARGAGRDAGQAVEAAVEVRVLLALRPGRRRPG